MRACDQALGGHIGEGPAAGRCCEIIFGWRVDANFVAFRCSLVRQAIASKSSVGPACLLPRIDSSWRSVPGPAAEAGPGSKVHPPFPALDVFDQALGQLRRAGLERREVDAPLLHVLERLFHQGGVGRVREQLRHVVDQIAAELRGEQLAALLGAR